MYQHNALKAYRTTVSGALSDRDADAECFRKLIAILEAAKATSDVIERNKAISKNQRLWSLIQRANAVDSGLIETEERLLFARMADSAQRYGIRAMLDSSLSLQPLIDVAQNVLEGLSQQEGA